jgi:hypothetical protein
MKRKLITEEQAIELAMLLGCHVVVNKNRTVYAFVTEPILGKNEWLGFQRPYEKFGEDSWELPVIIKSDKNWTMRIYKPCRLTDNEPARFCV